MSLSKKISRLRSQTNNPIPKGNRSDRVASIRQRLQGLERSFEHKSIPKQNTSAPDPTTLPGTMVDTKWGPLYENRVQLDITTCHGDTPIHPAIAPNPTGLVGITRDATLEHVDLRGVLFFDTETTGLAGGTGTVPFLIGLAWFDDSGFQIRQLLLPLLGQEKAMLETLADALRTATCVASYNGKSFDWPLLRNRFVMNRLPEPSLPPHIDLLHGARRLFKRRLSTMGLKVIEEEVLGFTRVDDIDGSLIPQRYFDYLRGTEGTCLDAIVQHNRDDLIALPALLGLMTSMYTQSPTALDARVALSIAELAFKNGDLIKAQQCATAAAEQGREDTLVAEALCLSARLHKRAGHAHDALICLHRALVLTGRHAPMHGEIHLSLAKLYEHQQRDFSKALKHTAFCAQCESPKVHGRRRARLEHKLVSLHRLQQ